MEVLKFGFLLKLLLGLLIIKDLCFCHCLCTPEHQYKNIFIKAAA